MTICKATTSLSDMNADFKVDQLGNKIYAEKEQAVALKPWRSHNTDWCFNKS